MNNGSQVKRAMVSEQNDMPSQVAQERSEELGYVNGLKVTRLPPAAVQAQMLALGGYGEDGQGCRGDAAGLFTLVRPAPGQLQ